MNNSAFFIVGKHAVMEALKNPNRKVLRVFLTEESKKTINRENLNKNLLKNLKIFYKTKKELDNYCKNDGILHQGFVAEIEHLEKLELKEFIKRCLDPKRNGGAWIESVSSHLVGKLPERWSDDDDIVDNRVDISKVVEISGELMMLKQMFLASCTKISKQ